MRTGTRPFAGYLFAAIGIALAGRKAPIGLHPALALFIAGGALQVAESWALYAGGVTAAWDAMQFGLATIPFSIGAFTFPGIRKSLTAWPNGDPACWDSI